MDYFTYRSKYATYDNCYFETGRYHNGNLALSIWSSEEGPITKVTVNPEVPLLRDRIAVKDYAENEGMVSWLYSMGIIEQNPIQLIHSGYVEIPVYELTKDGKAIFGV